MVTPSTQKLLRELAECGITIAVAPDGRNLKVSGPLRERIAFRQQLIAEKAALIAALQTTSTGSEHTLSGDSDVFYRQTEIEATREEAARLIRTALGAALSGAYLGERFLLSNGRTVCAETWLPIALARSRQLRRRVDLFRNGNRTNAAEHAKSIFWQHNGLIWSYCTAFAKRQAQHAPLCRL